MTRLLPAALALSLALFAGGSAAESSGQPALEAGATDSGSDSRTETASSRQAEATAASAGTNSAPSPVKASPSSPAHEPGSTPRPAHRPGHHALDPPRASVRAVEVDDPRTILLAIPGPAEGIAKNLASRLPAERRALDRLLGLADEAPIEIRVGHGRDEFRSLQPATALAPGWAAGVAYPGLGLVVLDAQASSRSGDAGGVLRHELAHVALGRLLRARIPHWFTEGFAMLYADEWTLSRSATLARASAAGALIPLDDIDRSWPSSPSDVDLAYAQSASFVAFLARIDDGAPFHRLVAAMAEGTHFDDALLAAYGQPFFIHELNWKKSLRARFGWLPVFLDHELLWGWAALILVAGAWRIRRRKRKRLAAMPDDPEEGESNAEGTVVTAVTAGETTFELTEGEERRLDEAIAEADRGDFISSSELFPPKSN